MNLDKKDILNINRIVFDFIMNQNNTVLEKVLSGEYKLCIDSDIKEDKKKNNTKDTKKPTKKNSKSKDRKVELNYIEIINKLKSFDTMDEGREYLKSIKIIVKQLLQLAKVAEISVNSNDKKDFIIERIVAGTIGAKIKMRILQQG